MSVAEARAGERIRMQQSVERIRAVATGLETALRATTDTGPIGTGPTEALFAIAQEVARQASAHDAYDRVMEMGKPTPAFVRPALALHDVQRREGKRRR